MSTEYIYIYFFPSRCHSILGMHIFGCKFSLKTEAGDTVPDRKNFDSLLWAIVTVFQVGSPPGFLCHFVYLYSYSEF